MKPTTLQRAADSGFKPFSQAAGLNYWYCDTTSCSLPAEWQRTVRGVTLLYCTACKRRVEEASDV